MALVKSVLDRQLPVSDIFKDRLATCAGCLACEASCPSGVPVAAIIQAAKEQAIAEAGTGIIAALVSGALRHPAVLRASAWLAPFALRYTTIKSSEFRVQSSKSGERSTRHGGNGSGNKENGRVVFFPGCAIEHFQPEIGRAAVKVLAALGYEAIVPAGLKCCGRPLLSLGDRKAAEELAECNSSLLAGIEPHAIVTACASCGLTFKKEYPALLRSGAKTPAVLDIHEFLASRISGLSLGSVDKTITWHDPCHLGRGQGLSGAARDILRSVPGLSLVEMRDADRCCGFGGVMRITHHGLSDGIAEGKARNIVETRASAIATGCPGCRMQIAHALKLAGSAVEVLHTVQVLEEALSNAECGVRNDRPTGQTLAP
jgi:glycolate oxidase iron-sulfur subunit